MNTLETTLTPAQRTYLRHKHFAQAFDLAADMATQHGSHGLAKKLRQSALTCSAREAVALALLSEGES